MASFAVTVSVALFTVSVPVLNVAKLYFAARSRSVRVAVEVGAVPGAVVVVAAVVRLGVPVTTAEGSPLTKPVMVAVNGGAAVPNALMASSAVTVSAAVFTVSVPVLNVPK